MKKKILITGASGFIGKNLVEFYAKQSEYEVFGTYFRNKPESIKNVKLIKVDLTNSSEVDNLIEGMDILIQAAATTSGAKEIVEKPYYHVTDNAIMNALLFKAAYKFNLEAVVFFSCTIMYQSSDKAIKEEDFDPSEALNPKYFGAGETKLYNEKMCDFFSRIGSTKFLVLRHSNVYGPYDKYDLDRSHVFGATITKVLTNDTGEIVVWGDGSDVRDFIHVDDLVQFVYQALPNLSEKIELYNIGGDEHISISELVKKIIHYSGKEMVIKYDTSKPSIGTKVWLDMSKVKNNYSWRPLISLDQGIPRVIEWYKNNIK